MSQNKKVSQLDFDHSIKPVVFRYQFRGHRPNKEINTEPSMTIPDHGLSIPQLLERSKRGLPIMGNKPVFNGDFLLPVWSNLDLAERQRLLENAKATTAKRRQVIMDGVKSKVERLKKLKADKLAAEQGPKVQRTSGDADDQSTKP